MPIYEYQCGACGREVEILQKISDDPARNCPECGKSKLQRNISAAGFRLSGTGWYETDFKKNGRKNVIDDTDASKSVPSTPAATSTDKKESKKADTGKKDSGKKKESSG